MVPLIVPVTELRYCVAMGFGEDSEQEEKVQESSERRRPWVAGRADVVPKADKRSAAEMAVGKRIMKDRNSKINGTRDKRETRLEIRRVQVDKQTRLVMLVLVSLTCRVRPRVSICPLGHEGCRSLKASATARMSALPDGR